MSLESRFRTPDGMRKFLEAYDNSMALWNQKPETLQVQTGYGMTHVNALGNPDNPPLVLVHGGQISSPMWYNNVDALSEHFRVYAPDVIDQMGKSVPTKRLQTEQDCANWLSELLDGLQLDNAILIGHSHGGWQVLNMAIQHPERVKKLILLSPAASFSRISFSLLGHMLPVLVMPTKGMFYWSFQWMTVMPLDAKTGYPLVDQFRTGAMNFKPNETSFGVVSVFTEAQLQRATMPTLLLIGENEAIYRIKPAQVLEKALQSMPNIEGELIPNSKHLFPISQASITNQRMLEFLLH